MRDPIAVLKSLTEKSKDESYKFQRLYRNLYNPEFYYLALKNIYANKGAMTPGADGITLDCFSEKRIARIIESLKNHSYQPKPARREYIPKKSNPKKKRPLGIPSGDDKLIQEVVRMVLESIYEPAFSNRSHGFRPKRSCHTALRQIQNTFTGTRCWVSYSNGFCFRNMMPCSFDYLIYPYYPAYTMGCYQIVINGDNGRQSILLFLCWFTTLIIAQKAGKCNIFAALFYFPLPIIIGLLQKDSQGFCICHIVFIVEKKTIFIKLKR